MLNKSRLNGLQTGVDLSVLLGRYGGAFPNLEDRLRFQQGQFLGKGMIRVDVQFLVSRVGIDEGERCEPVV